MRQCPLKNSSSQNYQYFNDLISRLCNNRRFTEAINTFFSFNHSAHQQQSSLFFPSTYARLFAACASLRSLDSLRQVDQVLSNSSIRRDIVLYNNLLTAYGKCGGVEDARKMFDEIPERNNVSWSSIISCFCQNHRELEAVEFYLMMLGEGLTYPDRFAVGSVVRAASGLCDVELGRKTHAHAVKFGYGSDSLVQNALVNMYSNCEWIDDANVVFQRIEEKDPVSWGAIIAGLAKHGCELECLLVFKMMLDGNASYLNEFHFGSVLSSCGSIGRLEYGEQIHCICVKIGFDTDAHAGCSLSDMYARCGMLDSAKKSFYCINDPDIVSWNSMIGALANRCLANEAMLMFSELRGFSSKPDNITLRCLLCAFVTPSSLCQGQLIHSFIVKTGFGNNIGVQNTLLAMYSKCSDLSTALCLFDEMNTYKDRITWNTIFGACVHHDQPEDIFQLVKLMHHSSEEPDHVTIKMILNSCAVLGFLEMVNQIHAYSLKLGLGMDSLVTNALIDSYSKCGSLEEARQVFELLGNHCDAFSWSSLIVGYAQFGYGKIALQLFEKMQFAKVTPNPVAFVGVMIACSREGLLTEGRHYYEMMQSFYGIMPTREHCSCLVDLLARTGRLKEAENFIRHMPVEPDVIVWKSLLAACRVYKNIEIGERAAESILKLDPSNSTAYILLCSIYASCGCWDDVSRVRKMMKGNSVRKLAGKSWINVKGELHVFIVEDCSHPAAEDIYLVLEILWFEMKEDGCEPELVVAIY